VRKSFPAFAKDDHQYSRLCYPMASEQMPNPGQPMRFFGKCHIDSPTNSDLNRKSYAEK